MNIQCTEKIKAKLAEKHAVTLREVQQCFDNREGRTLFDTRLEHKTTPPTQWFIAETNRGRKLKVCFILETNGAISLKTAYPPNPNEQAIYDQHQ